MHMALAKKNGLTINQNGEYEHSDPMRTGRFHLIGRPPAFIYGFTGVKNSYKQLSEHIDIWLQHRHEKQGDVELKTLPAVIATQGCFAWRNSAPLAIKSARLLGLGTDPAPVRLIVMHLMHLLNRRLSTKTDSFGLKPNLNAYMKQFTPPEFLSTLGKLSLSMPPAELDTAEQSVEEEAPIAEAEPPVTAEAAAPAPTPVEQTVEAHEEPETVAEHAAEADDSSHQAAASEEAPAAAEAINIEPPAAAEAEPAAAEAEAEPVPAMTEAEEAPAAVSTESPSTPSVAEVEAEPATAPAESQPEPETAPVQQTAEPIASTPETPPAEPETPATATEQPAAAQAAPEPAQQPAATLGSGIPSSFDNGGTPGAEAEDYVPEFIVEESFPEGGEIEEEPMPVNTSAGLSGGPDFPTLEDPEEGNDEELESTLVMEQPKPSETHTASEIKKAINEYKEEQQADVPASQESDDDQFAQTLVLNSPPPQMPTESEKPANINGSGTPEAAAEQQATLAEPKPEPEEDPYTQTLVMSSPPPMAKPNGGQQAAAPAENPEPFPQLAPEKTEEVDPFTSTVPQ